MEGKQDYNGELEMNKLMLLIPIILISTVLFSNQANAETLPLWSEKLTTWFIEGKISSLEYKDGMQYIKSTINHDISNHISVNISSDKQYSFDTFTRVLQIDQNITPMLDSNPNNKIHGTQFGLESVITSENNSYYRFVSKYVNGEQSSLEPFDISIDVKSDHSTIETISYSKCIVLKYWVYTNDNQILFRYGDIDKPEYRDRTLFNCQGLHLIVPKENL